MPRDLNRLLRPRSIAVVGGGAWGRAVLRGLAKSGYDGRVFAVHPRAESVEGIAAYARIADLPVAPDASFIGVNRSATISIVRDLAAMGAGGAVCFASGFAEAQDGGDLHHGLIDAAGDMPIVGPNCYGFINALDGASLWPDIHGLVPVTQGVAILTQSSNIALNLTMQRRGLPIAYIGTVGNQAQVDLSQMAEALLVDPRVTVLGLHIEGIGDLSAFESMAATARRLGKPVIVLKTGRSVAAQEAAVSHTASLSGSDAGAAALFKRLRLARVESLEGFLEALKLAHAGPLHGISIAALSCSGGEAALIADAAAARGLSFSPLTSLQRTQLGATLGPMVTLANPLDYHTFIWGDQARMTQVYTQMMTGDAALTLLIADFPRNDRCKTNDWEVLIAAAIAARQQVGRPLAILASLPETLPEDLALRLSAAGLIPLCGLEPALEAIAACLSFGPPERDRPPVLHVAPSDDAVLMDEAQAKVALAAFGLSVPRFACVDTLAAAVAWAGDRRVALKTLGAAHKSDTGGVTLNLQGRVAIEQAARTMPDGGFLIEEMIPDGVAELLIGVLADPAHGYVLTLGAGGVWAELWQDTVHLLLPVGRADVLEALERLRIAPLLHGYRGAPAASRDAIARAVLALQDYVIAQSPTEVEINPLIATPSCAVAVDALIRRSPAPERSLP